MFTRDFHLARFLRVLHGTEPFADYCRSRGIHLAPTSTRPAADDVSCWSAALATLPEEARTRVERELAWVNELGGRDGVDHLLDAAGDGGVPPDDVPAGPAVALWFFVHRPDHFHEVFFHHETREASAWRTARARPGIAAETLPDKAPALAAELQSFFRRVSGGGRFCAVDAELLPAVVSFTARVAERLRYIESFTDRGEPDLKSLRPAVPLRFTYAPQDGSVRVRSPLRAADRIAGLLECFGRSVLGVPLELREESFDLNRLKHAFHPLPDAPDMQTVRVRALHLRYPARGGRRHLRLETLAGDEPGAIGDMILGHAGADADALTVCHAELQVTLRIDGRIRNYPIRLWPDRCDLGDTPLGERLRQCLRLWGLTRE